MGADAVDWKAVAAKDHLDDLHMRVEKMKAAMKEIRDDQVPVSCLQPYRLPCHHLLGLGGTWCRYSDGHSRYFAHTTTATTDRSGPLATPWYSHRFGKIAVE